MTASTDIFSRICAAIGYHEEDLQQENGTLILLFDGKPLRVEVLGNRIIFNRMLYPIDQTDSGRVSATLAGYAAGRLLKEEAILSYDKVRKGIILWQSVPLNAENEDLRRSLELFLVSCDWWESRVVEETTASGNMSSFSEFVIMP